VYVVAIVELCATVEAEAVALSADVGMTVYEARLVLASGTPAIVRSTSDRAQALDLATRLRERGHDVALCDTSDVVPSQAMTSMRRFRFGPACIEIDAGPSLAHDGAPPDRLPYDDVGPLIAAVHRKRIANESESSDRKLSVGRAIMSGGIVMTKTVKRETRSTTEDREQVLYVFRRSGAKPWILREHGTNWKGHGRPVAPTAAQNFRIASQALRERAPRAPYDDRLVGRKSAPERMAVAGGLAGTTTTTSSSETGVDLLAHLLALSIKAGAGP
jgi:hypothetical protein